MTKIYVIDFENNNNKYNIENNITNLWLADICSLDDYSHNTVTNIDDFIQKIKELSPAIFYSHNLKYDGIFIIDYLLNNGFTHSTERKIQEKQFSTLITVEGVFYNIKVNFEDKSKDKKANKIAEFRDSLKKIKGSVEEIAYSFDLPILKGSIDYEMLRPVDYKPTEKEIEYIKHDTEIIARVLNKEYEKGLDRLTTASDAMAIYKQIVGTNFAFIFPELNYENDKYIRKSYRGGIVYLNPKYKEKLIEDKVYCFDVNSMYPFNMTDKPLPYGYPAFFKGKYIEDKTYPLYIQHIFVDCKLKPNRMPTILLDNVHYGKLTYVTDTDGEMLELYLTKPDFELLIDNYEIFDIKYIDGMKFYASKNLFKKYIIPLYENKCKTKGSEKQLNKILLNGLYGKFALNPKHQNKIPYMNTDNIVSFKNGQVSIDKTIYTAVSSFITGYSRKYLIDTIHQNYDNFIYCDTDSIHLLTPELIGAPIDDKELGAFKLEKVYIKSKYIAQKCYMGKKEDGKKDVKIAGCPKNIAKNISFDNFYIGNTFNGKLLPKKVKGGSVLITTAFTIKNR